MVKIFCALGIHEPGDNFLNEKFRWTRESESMPGWELVRKAFSFLLWPLTANSSFPFLFYYMVFLVSLNFASF
jgi:hypothetical protein